MTDGVDDFSDVLLSDRNRRNIEPRIDAPEGVANPAVGNKGVLRNVPRGGREQLNQAAVAEAPSSPDFVR